MIKPLRGHLYQMYGPEYGTLHCLVIGAFAGYDHCTVMRVSVTRERHSFPFWVRLQSGDPAFGYVVCHEIYSVGLDELKEDLGELCAETRNEVKRARDLYLG